MKLFKKLYQSKKSKARLGEIHTVHGVIKTPSFVPVATKGTLKAIPPNLISDIGTQVAFVNTYHLVTHPGPQIVAKAGGIHKMSRLNIPLMSDSGGFQVFSLAQRKRDSSTQFLSHESLPAKTRALESEKIAFDSSFKNQKAKIKHFQADVRGEEKPLVVKISEDGVKFRSTFDGKMIEFTPEKSIEYQQQIGADLMMAFDECTYYPSTYKYATRAMERTHQWLTRCIKYKNNIEIRNPKPEINSNFRNSKIVSKIRNSDFGFTQYLYGVIQGGTYEDLRKKSAEFVCAQDVDGVAIGGVSVGETKKEMRDQVKWVSDYLPKEKPVHLLGVGQIDDIADLVGYGIDTFDCVEPTRLARMGTIYQAPNIKDENDISKIKKNIQTLDINKNIYKDDLTPVNVGCNCYVCRNFTKSYLHHLFKQREILGYTLATYHNLWVMERLFEKIRDLVAKSLI